MLSLRCLAFLRGHNSHATIGFMDAQRNSHQVYELGYRPWYDWRYEL